MKDEIKEILDNLKDDKQMCSHSYYRLFIDDRDKLLDYITNLQEQLHKASLDIQELTEKDIGCPSWCDKLNKLQEENKRLKKDKGRVVSEREDLLSSCLYQDEIIKKAIEYIEQWRDSKTNIIDSRLKGTLEILRGEDDESN